jgi:hypothetical protein
MYTGLFVVAGAVFTAMVLISESIHLALSKAAEAGDQEALPALVRLDEWAGASSVPAAVAMLIGAATAMVTTWAFPGWLGALTGVVALLLIVGLLGISEEPGAPILDLLDLSGVLLLLAWVLATSVVLVLRPGDGPHDEPGQMRDSGRLAA